MLEPELKKRLFEDLDDWQHFDIDIPGADPCDVHSVYSGCYVGSGIHGFLDDLVSITSCGVENLGPVEGESFDVTVKYRDLYCRVLELYGGMTPWSFIGNLYLHLFHRGLIDGEAPHSAHACLADSHPGSTFNDDGVRIRFVVYDPCTL